MKECGYPTQMIQILIATGHPSIAANGILAGISKITHALLTPKEFSQFQTLVKVTKP
jgi:hypothetical protein